MIKYNAIELFEHNRGRRIASIKFWNFRVQFAYKVYNDRCCLYSFNDKNKQLVMGLKVSEIAVKRPKIEVIDAATEGSVFHRMPKREYFTDFYVWMKM